jgi:hypothetical protein
VIVWVNGTFGAGKTSACRELVELLPGSVLYDPELVGSGLRRMLPADRMATVADYQDLPSWRRLVPEVAAALLSEVEGPLVVPMTLLREDYRDEIFGALAARGLAVHHFVLDPAETILQRRIDGREECPGDPEASARVRTWCREHLPQYRAARRWLSRDARLIDTGGLTPRQTAELLAELVKDGVARCPIVQTVDTTGDTVAAAVLLFDEQDRVLLVDPVYKPSWEFPGGVVERGEAPTDAALRETAEELGLRLEAPALRLLAVDCAWSTTADAWTRRRARRCACRRRSSAAGVSSPWTRPPPYCRPGACAGWRPRSTRASGASSAIWRRGARPRRGGGRRRSPRTGAERKQPPTLRR